MPDGSRWHHINATACETLEKVCMAGNSLFMILNSTMEEDFLYPPETDDTGEFMDEYYGENLYEADLSYGELYDDEFMYERIPFLELADKWHSSRL